MLNRREFSRTDASPTLATFLVLNKTKTQTKLNKSIKFNKK